MRLLTEDVQYGDDNHNTSPKSNIEYAAGSDNLFTQPYPPTIAGDVESLADDVEPHANNDGDLVYESESDHYNDDDDVVVDQTMKDIDHE